MVHLQGQGGSALCSKFWEARATQRDPVTPNLHKRINLRGAGEMAQWLRALPALPEDLGSSPSTYTAAHNLQTPGHLMSLVGLSQHQADNWGTHTHRQTTIYLQVN